MSEDGAQRIEIDTETNEVSATRRLRRSGNSTVVSLPPTVLSVVDITEGTEMTITAEPDGQIDIEPTKTG